MIKWDGEPSGHSGNPDNWSFPLKKGYVGSLKFRCYYLQYVHASSPGIESRWGRDFPHLSRPALRPTQPPVQWVPGLSRG
jgi:hypothetical protein